MTPSSEEIRMMKKTLTVAAGWIAGSMLTLAAAPAIAQGGGYPDYGVPDRHGRYWDGDDGRSQYYGHRHEMPFAAWVTMAPPPGAFVSGMIRLEVRGRGLVNVELLPASGYTPKLGIFNVSPDGRFAWLDFDTRALSEGRLDVRISAFNVPANYPGASEIVAMPPRPWNVR
jgi:hypothetical protein